MTGSRRKIILGAAAISVFAIATVSHVSLRPILVWNASASASIGLYRLDDRAPELGDLVLVKPGETLEQFITDRGYLPPDIPLLKHVAAVPGDEICRENEAVFINKEHVADALMTDSLGREMPSWRACFTLKSDEVFLLNPPQKSLDGRYFGATKAAQIIAIAMPIWIRSDAQK